MGASITLAGESLIAQKQGAQQILTVSRFILANVPGLDPNGPVDRAAGKPAAGQIVGTYDVTQAGYVNPNQVVYSLMLGSDIGDFDWNWIGLETAENVLLMVAYVPTQQKRRNIPPLQLGNNVTRNFLVVFDGAQALTGLTIDASTWQHDFTVRLAGIDERERQSNRDMFGRACFFGSALQLEKVGSVYQLKPGTAYVEGVRLQRAAALAVVPPAFPTTAWLDVALQRELNDVVASWSVVWGAGKVDYVDSAGVQHYCVAIADLPSSSTITDRRPVEDIAGALIEHFASRAFVRAELEKLDSKQSVRVATTANIALTGLQTIDGVVLSAGDRVLVKNQGTASQNGIYTAASGAWARAGDADASLEVTPGMLVPVEQGATNGDSLWQLVTDAPITLGTTGLTFEIAAGPVGIAAGTYRSVTVDKRGRVIGGTNPTTLAGYGITDAQPLAQILSDHVANSGWGIGRFLVSTEADLANYKTGGKFVTPQAGLVGLPNGWSQGRHVVDVSGGSSYCTQLLTGASSNKGRSAIRTWDGTAWGEWLELWHTGNFDPGNILPQGFMKGLVLSNNGALPNTDIDIALGAARSADDSSSLRLQATLTKRLQSAGGWAAGSSANGLFSGARAADTWYHLFLIRNPATNAIDAGFDTSPDAVNRPTAWTQYRRLGSVRTDSSGNIIPFVMEAVGFRRRFKWVTPIMDVQSATLTSSATIYTVSVPQGVKVLAELNPFFYANNAVAYFSSLDTVDLAPQQSGGFPGFTGGISAMTDASADGAGMIVEVMTNSTAQIRARGNRSMTISMLCLGWEE
ncbi:phage tail protein [Pseudomonas anguilliseptica]|uniref:phage tail protein n=1 Tax=Pseudomonas anguilliseptica TaxID=53406 RepID=UPI0022AE94FF|nr:phage tail protein [Pseudomonas anguilliseptica]MCZ4324578.1 phage tail protein [Pseudomonas anguilliseptica]